MVVTPMNFEDLYVYYTRFVGSNLDKVVRGYKLLKESYVTENRGTV